MAEAKFDHLVEKLLEVLGETQSEVPSVQRVFQKMIDPPYKGKVLISHVSKMSPEDFTDFNYAQTIRWFRLNSEKFAVFEGNDGRIAMFAILVKDAKLCWKSNRKPSECKDDYCVRFHVCQKYIGGHCTAFDCPADHHFQSEHSRKLLKLYKLDKYNDDDLMTIFRQSHLQVCNFYDRKGTCDNEDRCTKIHLCADFVQGTCTEPCPKKLKHEFNTTHSKRLLRVYDLHDRPERDTLNQILVMNHFGVRKRETLLKNDEVLKALAEALFNFEETEVKDKRRKSRDTVDDRSEREADEQFKAEAEQATDKLNLGSPRKDTGAVKKVPKASTSIKAACPWEMEIFGDWKPLGQIRSRRLEEAYCDPDKGTINITLPDIEDCLLFDTFIKVNFDTMTATLLEGDDNDALKIRRQGNPDDGWLWYFLTDDDTYVPYAEDDQFLLETTFTIKEKRVLVGKGEIYRVKFSDMTQRNRSTGMERRIRRRPILL